MSKPKTVFHETSREKPPSLEDRYKAGMTEAGVGNSLRDKPGLAEGDTDAIIAGTRRMLTPSRERERLEAARRAGEAQGRGFAETAQVASEDESTEVPITDARELVRSLSKEQLDALQDALFAEEDERGIA